MNQDLCFSADSPARLIADAMVRAPRTFVTASAGHFSAAFTFWLEKAERTLAAMVQRANKNSWLVL